MSDNPFAGNPFTNGVDASNGRTVPAATGGAWGRPSAPAPSVAGAVPSVTAPSAPAPNAANKGREAELMRREAELNAREAELRRWEADLRSSGRLVPKKNWPKCCPLTVMDIKAEVPPDLQGVVSCAYWSYLLLVICLTFQVLCTIVAIAGINVDKGRITGFILSIIYWVIGIPVAWILWYYRLYNAAKKDAAFTYAWFFLAYLVHIFWCIWSAVSPPILFNRWSYAGWLTALVQALPTKLVVGVFYIIGASLWTLESILSVWVLQLVYRKFRGGNVDARLKSQALQSAVSRAASHV